MTFDEWRDQITHELIEAGFEVEQLHGFPFIPARSTESFERKFALLEFDSTLPRCINLYKEGCLITPEWPAMRLPTAS